MPSSTSNSKELTPKPSQGRPIIVALVLFALLLVGLETATRFGFRRISRIEARIYNDHAAAVAVSQGGPTHPTILLLGNSLLLEGIDYAALRQSMMHRATPVRFVVDNTSYLDWYYGLRRLFAEGARPDRVVVCLSISQLLATSLRGEYSAFYLIDSKDLTFAGREAGFDLTGISGLYFAHYSMFYAGRNGLRNFALNKVQPAYASVMHGFSVVPGRSYSDAEVVAMAVPRLTQLQALCSRYHAQFDLLLPPGFDSGSQGLIEAGKRSSVSVLVPVPQNSWPPDLYRDHFHLNREGAVRFTMLLATELSRER
jgi:hypothetical protein